LVFKTSGAISREIACSVQGIDIHCGMGRMRWDFGVRELTGGGPGGGIYTGLAIAEGRVDTAACRFHQENCRVQISESIT
jgi:hypothetical protein